MCMRQIHYCLIAQFKVIEKAKFAEERAYDTHTHTVYRKNISRLLWIKISLIH